MINFLDLHAQYLSIKDEIGKALSLVASDVKLDTQFRLILNHGRITKYHNDFEGRNSRLGSIQITMLIVKFKYLGSRSS